MPRRNITRDEFFSLFPIATEMLRKRLPRGEAERLAASLEANRSGYERAQSDPDQDGIKKEVGVRMISAAAKDAERRLKKKRK